MPEFPDEGISHFESAEEAAISVAGPTSPYPHLLPRELQENVLPDLSKPSDDNRGTSIIDVDVDPIRQAYAGSQIADRVSRASIDLSQVVMIREIIEEKRYTAFVIPGSPERIMVAPFSYVWPLWIKARSFR